MRRGGREEGTYDIVDNLKMSRQDVFDKRDRPFLHPPISKHILLTKIHSTYL